VWVVITLARTVPGDVGEEVATERRSTVRVFRRFFDMAATAVALARSLDDARGDPAGVTIGVAAVRVMRGAGGGHAASTTGAGAPRTDDWRCGVDGGGTGDCAVGKDSESMLPLGRLEMTSSLVMATAGSIASRRIRSADTRTQ